jgi:heptaprenyl diphosphate synthase
MTIPAPFVRDSAGFLPVEGADPLLAARELVAADLARFEETLEAALAPQQNYLSTTEYELYRRGKKLRPVMLLLSARLCGGGEVELPYKAIRAATSLEMLHVATLIHDDIVDVAPVRRGMPSVFADRGTEMAVLIGDMQFIQAVRCFSDGVETQEDMRLVRLVLEVGFKICCGEIDELQTDPTLSSDDLRERYFSTVDRKTAALFGLACEAGASLVGARTRATVMVSRFGRCFGRAFQIMDDLFDFVRSDDVAGKVQGTDLRQRRLTLPIINALETLPADHVLRRVIGREPFTEPDIAESINAVVTSAGFFAAYSEARRKIIEAVEYLKPFPPGPYRDAMMAIAYYVVDRGVDGARSEL